MRALIAVGVACAAVLVFGVAPAGATRECEGLTVCVPKVGPWVVVPTSGEVPRRQVEYLLSCPKGYVVGGLDAVIRVWDTADWREMDGERPAVAMAEPPVDHGARLFRKCSACHELTAEQGGKAGPTLHRLFGRKAGEVPGYTYSPALKASGLVWTDATIDRLFALGPETVVPGSKMPLQRMPDPKDRAELIDFLARATRRPDPR